ncbi:hypothetical protein [Micromonospora sp. DT229]|uniref:hypothetical protein n=1 Tax=Micromonospora sp. DT229 TaxID=3393430 RepID=UPI003CF98864
MRILRTTVAALTAALVMIPLAAAPAAADTAGYTGLVTDSDAVPVANACLALHTSPTEVAAEYCTDADGRYTIPWQGEDREYKIRVYAEGFRTQWWYAAPDHLNAERTWIPSYDLVERNVTLGRGSAGLRGRITDPEGAPAEVTVEVNGVDGDYRAIAYTWDLGDGRYQFENLPPGRYRVSVYDNRRGTQWVPGRESPGEATVYDLAAGDTLVVDEQLLPLGVVEARVVDAVTGAPVARPCLHVAGEQGCGSDGVVRLTDVRPGSWEISVSGGAAYFPLDPSPWIEVTRGQTTRVSYELEPAGAIVTTVQDAATGTPVGGICVRLVTPKFVGQSARMGSTCSDTDGRLEIGPFGEGSHTWNLYAFQPTGPYNPPPVRYGEQWVTANGGSGDQRQALAVTVTARQTTTIPPIKVDPPGAITGTIRDAAGQPVSGVCAYPFAFNPNQGHVFAAHCSNGSGVYTIGNLGPYRWPVAFTPTANSGYAWQWSGDAADRFTAKYTRVRPGVTARVDANLVAGGLLTGTVTDGDRPVDAGYVWSYNARTGDVAGAAFANITRDGTFTLRGHRTQKVYVEYWSLTDGCWYSSRGGTPSKVAVTAGASVSIAADMTRTCGAKP